MTTTVVSLLALRLVHGAAFGVATSSIATITADVVPAKRRGEGIGVLGLTSPLGMAVGPLVGLHLLAAQGPRFMFVSIALISLLAALSASGTGIRYKNPTRKTLSVKGLIHKKALPISTAMFFVMTVYGSVLVFIGIYALQRGFPAGFFFIVASMVLLGLAASEITFLIAGILAGFGFGSLMPTSQAAVNDLVTASERGAANSTYFFAYDVGIGTGAFVVGFFADKVKVASLYLYGSSVVLIGGVIFFLAAIPHYYRHKGLPSQTGKIC